MLNDERREAIETLDKLIRDTVPEQRRWLASNMLGYGKFKYENYKKEIINWPLIAMASQKNYVSLYVCALDPVEKGKYIAEVHADDLYKDGVKPNVGKSCIRFKKLDDLNLDGVKKVLKAAAENPGLVAG